MSYKVTRVGSEIRTKLNQMILEGKNSSLKALQNIINEFNIRQDMLVFPENLQFGYEDNAING